MFFKKDKNENNDLSKVAALLIHAAKIDENFSKSEEVIIKQALLQIGANNENLEKIFLDGKKIEENSNQILEFTKEVKNILLWRPSDITKIQTIAAKGGNWILLIKSATNVLKGDNYVFVSPDLLENKFIVKKGDVITSSILEESDLNLKSINLNIKSLLRKTRDEIKSKGSQVSEINTSGNFVKKIREFLQENK